MDHPHPYRVARHSPTASEAVPRSIVIGLSFGAWAFAASAVLWIVDWANIWFEPTHDVLVFPVYRYTVEVALVATAAACSWRPVPGSRSHLFARAAVIAWIVAMAVEAWAPDHVQRTYNACGDVVAVVSGAPHALLARSGARIVVWLALAGLAIAAGRRFAAPRWALVAGAGLALPWADLAWTDRLGAGFSAVPAHPTFLLSLAELATLLAFAIGFSCVAHASRRRIFVDVDALASADRSRPDASKDDLARWTRANTMLLSAFVFVLASAVGETLDRTFFGVLRGTPIPTAGAVLVVLPVAEYARRRCAGSRAVTFAALFAALFGVMTIFSSSTARHVRLLEDLTWVTTAFIFGGTALLLPELRDRRRPRAAVRGALTASAIFLTAAGLGDLFTARTAFFDPGRTTGRLPLLLAAFGCACFALRSMRPLEREALIRDALARRHSPDP